MAGKLDDKTVSRVIRLFSYAALLGILIWTLPRMSLISQIGTEDIYWERARYLLGYSDVSLYDGRSLCSLGYSLILVPICALTGTSLAAYRTALILNMVFLGAAFRMAVAAAKKVFPEEKESFLSAAGFLAVLCPVFAYARSCVSPDMAALFLTWCCIYLLAALWRSGSRRYLVLLSVCLIAISFLQITSLGMILAVMLITVFFVRKKRVGESAFLIFLLAVFAGVAACNAAERAFLCSFAAGMDLSVIRTSLEVFFSSIGSIETADCFGSLLSSLAGKLCTVMISSFLLICPGLSFALKGFIAYTKREYLSRPARPVTRKQDEEDPIIETEEERAAADPIPGDETVLIYGIVGMFLAQLVLICLYGCSQDAGERMLSVSGLYMVLSPMILVGMVCFRNQKNWKRELSGSLLLLAFCTVVAAGALNASDISDISNDYGGFLMIFRTAEGSSLSPANTVYLAACFAAVLSALFFILLRGNVLKGRLIPVLRGAGVLMLIGVFGLMNMLVVNWSVRRDSLTFANRVSSIVSLISDTSSVTDCLYIDDSGDTDLLPILQFLLPDLNVSALADDTIEFVAASVADSSGGDVTYVREGYSALDSEMDNAVILTAAGGTGTDEAYEKYSERLDGWQALYFEEDCILWLPKGSEAKSEIEERADAQAVQAGDTEADAKEQTSESYSYGEEADLEEFAEILSCLESGAYVYIVQELTAIRDNTVSYSDVQELLRDHTVSVVSYNTAMEMPDDALLLTRGLSLECMDLLEQYSIVGHAGVYTLWAKTEGRYLITLAEQGYGSLSSGTKLSVTSLKAMMGQESDTNELLDLPQSKYRIYLRLSVKSLEPGTMVRVSLWRNKTESEIEEEVNDLMLEGYTEEEARAQVKDTVEYSSEKFTTPSAADNGSFLVSVTSSYTGEISRLYCTAATPPGISVGLEILWIERIE